MHISENHQQVTEANARWTFEKQSIFSLLPRDQKIENPRKQTDKDAKRFQVLYLMFVTDTHDSKFQVQVTFPDHEELERRRKLTADQLNSVMGLGDVPTGSAMALSLKKAHLNHRDDGLTLDEREEQAETRFKAI